MGSPSTLGVRIGERKSPKIVDFSLSRCMSREVCHSLLPKEENLIFYITSLWTHELGLITHALGSMAPMCMVPQTHAGVNESF